MNGDDVDSADPSNKRDHWNRAVIAGSVAPQSARWLFAQMGWRRFARQLVQLSGPSRRRAILEIAVAVAVAIAFLFTLITGHERLAAWAALALFALVGAWAILFTASRLIGRRQQ